jgi:hypothetical protein
MDAANFLISALKSLPAVATSPLALAAYLVTILAWFILGMKVNRHKALLDEIEKLPESDRYKAIREEISHPIPENISAEEYQKGRIHSYIFRGFLVLCGIVILLIVRAGFTYTPPNPSDERIKELRGKERNVQLQYEKWKNPQNPSRAALAQEIITRAEPVANEYSTIDDSKVSSPKYVIEKYQRISALHSYIAAIHVEDKERYKDAMAHAEQAISNAQKALEEGDNVKHHVNSENEIYNDAFRFYAVEDPPTEEQILKWYLAKGLAISARSGKQENLKSAVLAVQEVTVFFPGELDNSMQWALQQSKNGSLLSAMTTAARAGRVSMAGIVGNSIPGTATSKMTARERADPPGHPP